MTYKTDNDILKKIGKLLDVHLAKEKPMEVPTCPLPKAGFVIDLTEPSTDHIKVVQGMVTE